MGIQIFLKIPINQSPSPCDPLTNLKLVIVLTLIIIKPFHVTLERIFDKPKRETQSLSIRIKLNKSTTLECPQNLFPNVHSERDQDLPSFFHIVSKLFPLVLELQGA